MIRLIQRSPFIHRMIRGAYQSLLLLTLFYSLIYARLQIIRIQFDTPLYFLTL